MTEHKIGAKEEFSEKTGKKVNINGIEIAVFKINNEFYGIQNHCPHKNLPLDITGKDRYYSNELIEEGLYDPEAKEKKAPNQDIRGGVNEDRLTINCPWHYLEWDLESGSNEAMGVCIATYDIEVKDDGSVWIEI